MRDLQTLSKRQSFLILVTTVLLLCLFLGLLGEAVVRIRQWMKRGTLWTIESTYVYDSETGLRVPIAGGQIGPVVINSLGFRSPELENPKSTESIRLAFLGASTTFCGEVSNNHMTWPHLVWQTLQQAWPDVKFEYINAGVPGYDLDSSLRNLELRVKQHKPDVIFVYHATNDLSRNGFQLAAQQGLIERQPEKALSWLSKYSLFWYLVEKNLRIILIQGRAENSADKLVFDPEKLTKPFRTDLLKLVRASQHVADLVVLVTFSHRLRGDQTIEEQKEAAATAVYYMPYMSIKGLLDGYDIYNDVIREIASHSNTLLVGNEDGIPGDGVHFVDSVHFSDNGSRAMANRITDALLTSQEFKNFVRAKLPG